MYPIVCAWSMRLSKGEYVVWPDGCRDLIVVVSRGRISRMLCTGLDAAVRRVVRTEETLFFGVRLAPGSAFPWEKAPDTMRADLPLSRYLSSYGGDWSMETDGETALRRLVELTETLVSPVEEWVSDCLMEIGSGAPCRIASLSERTARRRLVQATGAPPKFWSALARARRAGLELVRSEAPQAQIAADCGFSDQAHMSREIRRWFGCAPGGLREHRERALDRLAAPDAFNVRYSSTMNFANSGAGAIG